ncbi:5722_t:CDS:2, partial [Cetraspora pellucida]
MFSRFHMQSVVMTDIELAIERICETSVAHLEPECTKGKKWINTLPSNSNWFSWEWLCDGDYAGYLRARAIPNIITQHLTPKSTWFIPLLHKSEVIFHHSTADYLQELSTYKIYNILPNESMHEEFPLTLGWALKENQKFRKKRAGKRISKHVIAYLKDIFWWESDIPKVSTIQNWIARYAMQHKQKMVQ